MKRENIYRKLIDLILLAGKRLMLERMFTFALIVREVFLLCEVKQRWRRKERRLGGRGVVRSGVGGVGKSSRAGMKSN